MAVLFKTKPAAFFAMLALASIAMPALAQRENPVYRQGYEQGYRDGLEAARHERDRDREPQRREPERIRIERAVYGVQGRSCDATGSILGMARGRRFVDVAVNNDLCGDPSEGRPKRLWVTYRCGDGPAVAAEAREGEILSLNCR
jgi:hypothetical protein